MAVDRSASSQLSLSELQSSGPHAIFRRIYFRLYSNASASRAERIFDEIARLVLLQLIASTSPDREKEIRQFIEGSRSADDCLTPILADSFPQLFSPHDSFTTADGAIRECLADLSNLEVTESPASILGDAFQALIGPRLRGDKGQFFTPRALVKAMVRIAAPEPLHKVVDPAAGTGSFLVEAHAYRTSKHGSDWDFGPLIGVEKDPDIHRLGYALVALATGGNGRMLLGNSLQPETLTGTGSSGPLNADIVLTNPPFGSRIGIRDREILREFSLGYQWMFSERSGRWYQQREIRTSQDPQILFLNLCLDLLKPGGLLGIVLPEGMFGNRKSGYVWDYVRAHGAIESMIDVPRTAFQPGTDTKTNIVFIRKLDGEHRSDGKVYVAVAKHCGHDRRGRTATPAGSPVDNDFEPIAETYAKKSGEWWSACAMEDPYYLVPRYCYGKTRNPVEPLAAAWDGSTVLFGTLVREKALIVRKGNEVGADAYGTGPIPFVRTSDIHNWEVALDTTNGVSREIYERYKESQNLRPLDVLLVVDGRYRIGRTAILHANNCECVVQSHFRIITTTSRSPLDAFELVYVLSRPEVLEQIRSLVFIQSTLGSLGKRLEELVLPVPKKDRRWKKKVDDFRQALESRAGLLTVLEKHGATELEL